MKKVLGEIEEQIVTVLQKYHLKTEAKKTEEASKDGSLQGPLSSRKTSQSSKSLAISTTSTPDGATSAIAKDPESGHNSIPGAPPSPDILVSGRNAAQMSAGVVESQKVLSLKAISALVSKDQPYRYVGLRPPHLSMEELKKKDNVEEEYPLTYDELKVKVWTNDAAR